MMPLVKLGWGFTQYLNTIVLFEVGREVEKKYTVPI